MLGYLQLILKGSSAAVQDSPKLHTIRRGEVRSSPAMRIGHGHPASLCDSSRVATSSRALIREFSRHGPNNNAFVLAWPSASRSAVRTSQTFLRRRQWLLPSSMSRRNMMLSSRTERVSTRNSWKTRTTHTQMIFCGCSILIKHVSSSTSTTSEHIDESYRTSRSYPLLF